MGLRRYDYQPHPLDKPLDEYVGFATHVTLTCILPVCAKRQPCRRSVVWLTSDLYAMLPECRTVRDFRSRLYCKVCRRKDWVSISAARRS